MQTAIKQAAIIQDEVPVETAPREESPSHIRQHSRIYLQALINGHEVTLDGRVYRFFRPGEELETSLGTMTPRQPMLATRAIRIRDGVEQEIWLGTDLDLANFIVLAEAESFNAAFMVSARNAMTKAVRHR